MIATAYIYSFGGGEPENTSDCNAGGWRDTWDVRAGGNSLEFLCKGDKPVTGYSRV